MFALCSVALSVTAVATLLSAGTSAQYVEHIILTEQKTAPAIELSAGTFSGNAVKIELNTEAKRSLGVLYEGYGSGMDSERSKKYAPHPVEYAESLAKEAANCYDCGMHPCDRMFRLVVNDSEPVIAVLQAHIQFLGMESPVRDFVNQVLISSGTAAVGCALEKGNDGFSYVLCVLSSTCYVKEKGKDSINAVPQECIPFCRRR